MDKYSVGKTAEIMDALGVTDCQTRYYLLY
ncbi:FaeA/PapI family transcriptional regulator [Escherichia coli]